MKVVVQRVNHSSVVVDEKVIGEVGKGLMVLVGFGKDDDASKLKPMAEKIVNLRIFPDKNGRFHHSCLEVSGGILLVPQFTLYADTKKGRRPEFFEAKAPEEATKLFERFIEVMRSSGIENVEAGEFGAYMKVALENDGPVTISLEN